ncbi:ABC transporter permease [Wenzhouxiangella sediminis]|uniref:ABC transporter permease n=1 Tax=Wenzhouxiangella sediminis TaxID=1792836 RepID=A0A3E1K760_9GAMM|nr:ABC transporter permease [Wenzhouxiangella sediminis]RFF29870.1 ABC transporter permease [Wenzhouxiangella sediminis]
MRALDHKLLRDFSGLKGQVAAIAVVIAAGVMTLIIAVTSLDAISYGQRAFYRDHAFADVFAELKRAPEYLAGKIASVDGVNRVHTRVVAPVRLEIAGFEDPVSGQLISIPDGDQPPINSLHLREGRLPESGRADSVAVSEPFAEAHGLRAGDRLRAIINGRLETLTVSGIVLSPEYIYQLGPADLIPDYERFGVLWMNRRALARAFDMDGAFNSVVLTLQAGVGPEPVIAELDRLLADYGTLGAYARDEQVSHRILSQEIDQLQVTSVILPAIFLGVSAFLLSVLMGRIVRNQRQQVAVLKAFGYSSAELIRHYAVLTAAIVLVGVLVGVILGAWAADWVAELYMQYFRFPETRFEVRPQVIVLGTAVSGAAAMLGTWRAVREAAVLAPAVAMRPPAPATFRRGWLDRSRLRRWIDQPTRIILRNLGRHRIKASLSVLGIALSVALLVVGGYQFNAIDQLIDTQYRKVLKMDAIVHFNDVAPERAAAELLHYPGVEHVEAFRSVPVRLVHGVRDYRTAIEGMNRRPVLRGLIDRAGVDQELPESGLVLTDYLAEHLGARPGDLIDVEIKTGHRRTVQVPLAGVVAEPLGVSAYMARPALNRLMREGPAASGFWLSLDRSEETALFRELWDVPKVAGIGLIAQAEADIRGYIEDTMLGTMGVMLLLAVSIAFAVVYNSARIAFAERERELATLRVLGFGRGEVAWILVGELFVLTLLAIPLGWLLGTGLAWILTEAIEMDLFRIPFVISRQAYAMSAAGVLAAAVLSALLIAPRLARLDMVTALKSVE